MKQSIFTVLFLACGAARAATPFTEPQLEQFEDKGALVVCVTIADSANYSPIALTFALNEKVKMLPGRFTMTSPVMMGDAQNPSERALCVTVNALPKAPSRITPPPASPDK